MDEALDLSQERRVRKLRIAVRLVLYPLALALIAVSWHHGHGGGSHPRGRDGVGWQGVTSQGRAVKAVTSTRGLEVLNAYLVERCSDGSHLPFHWFPTRHRFVQMGDVVRGHQVGPTYTDRSDFFDNWAWVKLGDHPRGTIRTRTRLTTARGPVRCDSGPVTFSLRPTKG